MAAGKAAVSLQSIKQADCCVVVEWQARCTVSISIEEEAAICCCWVWHCVRHMRNHPGRCHQMQDPAQHRISSYSVRQTSLVMDVDVLILVYDCAQKRAVAPAS